jgi:peptidoglycan/LPS O-acetylase OafA/YrhL
MNLLIWVFIVYGITSIITQSKICKYPRRIFPALLSCSMCTSFWVGILLYTTPAQQTTNFIWDGFLASGTTWFLYSLTTPYQER